MEWLRSIITDPSLAPFIAWHPYKKFLHKNGHETPMYDEPCTGKRWWNIQVHLHFASYDHDLQAGTSQKCPTFLIGGPIAIYHWSYGWMTAILQKV